VSAQKLSIVSTMYRSRPYLERFLAECLQALDAIGCVDFEIVLVNDGSPDDSLPYAVSRTADIPQLVVIDLSRNFGHHHAIQAGLRHALGEQVFLIDCDLEVRPAVLGEFVAKARSTGADLVFGYQEARKGAWFERFSGGLFWRAINGLSDVRIPENMLTERLMTRRFLEGLLQLGDHNLFLGGMMSWTGFLQIGLPVKKAQREGRSSYTLWKRVQLMINAVSSFSSKPLLWLFNAGLVVTVVSFCYVLYLVMRKALFGDALLGFTSLMGFMAMSLGISTTALGLIGIYLGKVFNQVQNRPTFIVRDIHRASRSEVIGVSIKDRSTR
jgi:putative glycosyltransferase